MVTKTDPSPVEARREVREILIGRYDLMDLMKRDGQDTGIELSNIQATYATGIVSLADAERLLREALEAFILERNAQLAKSLAN